MPGIAKNTVRENLGYVESIARVQANADAGLRTKQAKAKQARLSREAAERRATAENPGRDTIAYVEKYFPFFKALYPLAEHERFKSKAVVEFREHYIQKYGRAETNEAREARRAHFNEQFEEWYAHNYADYTKECQKQAHDDAFAMYQEEIARGADLGTSFEDAYEHAQIAYMANRDSKRPLNFSVTHFVNLFRRMAGAEFAYLLRTGENASPNMREGARIVYKERKAEIDAVPRNGSTFPRVSAQPRVEEVGPNGETSATHDLVKETHKSGGKGQTVVAGTWVLRQPSSSEA